MKKVKCIGALESQGYYLGVIYDVDDKTAKTWEANPGSFVEYVEYTVKEIPTPVEVIPELPKMES